MIWTPRELTPEVALSAVCRTIAAANLALGFAILAGGPDRFPFPTYQPLLDLTHGEVWPWGLWIALGGGLMLIYDPYISLGGLVLSFAWYNMFAAMFIVSLVRYPAAGSTAPIPYVTVAVILFTLITLKLAECKRKKK